jgi:hypothetical protein
VQQKTNKDWMKEKLIHKAIVIYKCVCVHVGQPG